MNSKRILHTITIGAIAGIIDIIPMIIQGFGIYPDTSAFVFWIVAALVITHISLPVKDWLKGMIVAFILALPIIILQSSNGMIVILPIIISTIILGSLVGYATGKYCK